MDAINPPGKCTTTLASGSLANRFALIELAREKMEMQENKRKSDDDK